jgi:cytochrome c oxidase assembly protein subunit 15
MRIPRASDRADAPPHRGLRAGFIALLCATEALIVLGALVRARNAGLACPDWPLCFGEVLPRLNVLVAFELSHRALAGTIALAFAALALAARARPPARRAVGRLLVIAALLLATQIVLGGLTVLHLLASWTVTLHLLVGNAFAGSLLLIVLRLRADPAVGRAPRRARAALVACGVCLAAQMALGGQVSSRYAGLACTHWPGCREDAFLPVETTQEVVHALHRWNAVVLLGALAGAAWTGRGLPGLARVTGVALGLGAVQLGLGVANVLLGVPIELTALHSAAAALLVLLVTAALERGLRPLGGDR